MTRCAFGYAFIGADGAVMIKTVSPIARAAKVNWLVTEAKVWVSDATTDEQIERAWLHNKGEAECVRVQIEPF